MKKSIRQEDPIITESEKDVKDYIKRCKEYSIELDGVIITELETIKLESNRITKEIIDMFKKSENIDGDYKKKYLDLKNSVGDKLSNSILNKSLVEFDKYMVSKKYEAAMKVLDNAYYNCTSDEDRILVDSKMDILKSFTNSDIDEWYKSFLEYLRNSDRYLFDNLLKNSKSLDLSKMTDVNWKNIRYGIVNVMSRDHKFILVKQLMSNKTFLEEYKVYLC